jgi:hypothetical protein
MQISSSRGSKEPDGMTRKFDENGKVTRWTFFAKESNVSLHVSDQANIS